MIALLILACWWPSSAPSPSQPFTVETVAYETSPLADTAHPGGSDSPPEAGDPRSEAAPAVGAESKAGPGEPQARTDPGVGGDHAD